MIKSQERPSRERAFQLDTADPLGSFRDRFVFADESIYLDGNSLGRLPRATVLRLERVVGSEWGAGLIGSWRDGWMDLPGGVGDSVGSVALGAAPGQVLVGDSTTVCLYKLAVAALDARPGRTEILTDVDNFPTDRYVLEGLARARGLELRWLGGDPAAGPTPDEVAPLISERTALVSFSHVSYRSAHIAQMAEINALAHEVGALTLWDLSHSGGSVPVALDADGADLAVGCTYKYLCGGPGAPAYMYVRRELQDRLRQPIWGWLGRRDPFEMEPGFAAGSLGRRRCWRSPRSTKAFGSWARRGSARSGRRASHSPSSRSRSPMNASRTSACASPRPVTAGAAAPTSRWHTPTRGDSAQS